MVALVRPAQNEEEKVKKRFTEMAVISFRVAAMSILIGYALKTLTFLEAKVSYNSLQTIYNNFHIYLKKHRIPLHYPNYYTNFEQISNLKNKT